MYTQLPTAERKRHSNETNNSFQTGTPMCESESDFAEDSVVEVNEALVTKPRDGISMNISKIIRTI